MPDFRSFAPITEPHPAEIILSAEESSHLVRVNRARVGDPVVAFNGKGREWHCRCIEADRKATRLQVESEKILAPPSCSIYLAQALPKGKTLELIIRKATEIGATGIIPLLTERSEIHLNESRKESKHEKWEATAIEAAKQSGNSFLPEIAPVHTLAEFLRTSDSFDLKLIASLQPGSAHLRKVIEKQTAESGTPKKAIWMIGPEGDFSPEETAAALAAGFAPITLGRSVLRCETAAIYALSILSHELAR